MPQYLKELLHQFCSLKNARMLNFLLDASSIPEVISAIQCHGRDLLEPIFTVTRTWTYVLHRERLKILGRWNPHYKR